VVNGSSEVFGIDVVEGRSAELLIDFVGKRFAELGIVSVGESTSVEFEIVLEKVGSRS